MNLTNSTNYNFTETSTIFESNSTITTFESNSTETFNTDSTLTSYLDHLSISLFSETSETYYSTNAYLPALFSSTTLLTTSKNIASSIIMIISSVCNTQPCLNGGSCNSVSSTGYNCSCLPGYTGKNCDSITKDWTGTIIGVTIAGAVLIAILIGAIFIICNIKQRRSQAGVYNPKLEEEYCKKIDLSHVLALPPLERLI